MSADTRGVTQVIAATDGSAINNPHGPAGWSWFIGEDCWAAGGFQQASNQVAEMFALLALLRAVPREYPLLVRTDSQFVINVCVKWMRGWKSRNWRKADGQPVANLALVQDIDRALSGRTVKFQWVQGHSGDAMNEIADRLCTAASKAINTGQPITSGPGWTGFNPSPVIPLVKGAKASTLPAAGARPAGVVREANPVRQRPAAAAPSAGRAATRVVGERLTQRDVQAQGYGSNARVVRVSANALQGRPEPTKMEMCGSCDGPINPLTLHCRCGSM